MQQLTRAVLRHKRRVVIAWILLTLVGVAASGVVKFDQRFTVPGKVGWETNQQILKTFGNGGENPPTLVVFKNADRSTVAGVERKLQKALPKSRVAGWGTTGDKAFVSDDGSTSFIYAFPPPSSDPFGGNTKFAKAVKVEVGGAAGAKVTGFDALQDSSGGGDGPGV